MAILTNFLKLLKPEKNDYVDVDKHISENYDKIDSKMQELSTSNSGKLDKGNIPSDWDSAEKIKNKVEESLWKIKSNKIKVADFNSHIEGGIFEVECIDALNRPEPYLASGILIIIGRSETMYEFTRQIFFGNDGTRFWIRACSYGGTSWTEWEEMTNNLKTRIIDNADFDLNTINKTGLYKVRTGLTANKPPLIGNFTLYHEQNVGTVYQIAIADYYNLTYKRIKKESSGTAYTDWVLISGEITENLKDWTPLKALASESGKFILGTSGITGSVYIQDSGQKIKNKGYYDKPTGRLYRAKETNNDTSVTSNFEPADNIYNSVEVGTNSNGSYRKHPNGILECWCTHKNEIPYGSHIDLPYPFKDTNYTIVGTINNYSYSDFLCISKISNKTYRVGMHNTNATTVNRSFDIYAIGFWK